MIKKLLEFFNAVINHVNNYKSFDVIFLDFQEPCDTVLYPILLEKLRAHGIQGKLLNSVRNCLLD